MTFDIDKLNAGLESLTGRELENLERIARSMGISTAKGIAQSKSTNVQVNSFLKRRG